MVVWQWEMAGSRKKVESGCRSPKLDRPEYIDFPIPEQEESGDMLAILLGLFRLIWLFGRSRMP